MRVRLVVNVGDPGRVVSREVAGTLRASIGAEAIRQAATWRRTLKQFGEPDAAWNWRSILEDISRIEADPLEEGCHYMEFSGILSE